MNKNVYPQSRLAILFIYQKLQTATSTPGTRARMVWWTLSSAWPITSTPPPSISHGRRTGLRSQRGCRTCVTYTTATGRSTEFQRWVSRLGRATFTPVQWSIKPRGSPSPGAGVSQRVVASVQLRPKCLYETWGGLSRRSDGLEKKRDVWDVSPSVV